MKTVKEILATKPIYHNIVSSKDKVFNALEIMRRDNISYVIVMDEGSYVGIFGEKDYTQNGILQGRHSDSTIVRDVMVNNHPYVSIEDTSDKCLVMMDMMKVRYLVVIDELEFKGIITMHDLMREHISEKRDNNNLNIEPPEK